MYYMFYIDNCCNTFHIQLKQKLMILEVVMEYKNRVDVERQADLGMLALVYAMAEEEGKADHIRAIARAKYEMKTRREVKEVAMA